MPLGGRLLVRSRIEWRSAVVAGRSEEAVVLSVSSPGGRNYRLARARESELVFDGRIPYLPAEESEPWRENFSAYDLRW